MVVQQGEQRMDHNGKINVRATVEDVGNEQYLLIIKANNGDHLELPCHGKGHALERLRCVADAMHYHVLYVEGVDQRLAGKVLVGA